MRKTLTMLTGLIACATTNARGTEVRGEVTVGRDFLYTSSDVETEVFDGQLGLGAGLVMVSDFINERYGAQGLIEYRGEHVSAGVNASFGPRQLARGWASLDPHAELRFELNRLILRSQAGVLLRRVDASFKRAPISIDQLQLHVDLEASFDDCWTFAVFGLYSLYNPDPAGNRLRGLDLGLAVTLAGRPESWAVGGRLGARLVSWLRVELGVAGVSYADGSGSAVVPRAGLRFGPWRGFAVTTSVDVAVNVTDESPGQVREIAGLELEYER
jgi:hypothetical protein